LLKLLSAKKDDLLPDRPEDLTDIEYAAYCLMSLSRRHQCIESVNKATDAIIGQTVSVKPIQAKIRKIVKAYPGIQHNQDLMVRMSHRLITDGKW